MASAMMPAADQLWEGLAWGVLFTALRYLLNTLVFIPVAQSAFPARITRVIGKRTPPNDARLERVFQNSKTRPLTDADMTALATEHNMEKERTKEWMHRRRKEHSARKKLRKFLECCWRCVYYTVVAILGFYWLAGKPWLRDMSYLWEGYPNHAIEPEIQRYYMIELGFYIHCALALVYEERKKDHWVMMSHHIVTVILLCGSWLYGLVRIGALVLLVHDVSDPFLESSKLAHYTKLGRLTDTLFPLFAVVFFFSRLVVYPLYVLHSSLVTSYHVVGHVFDGYLLLNMLLCMLLLLHVFWFFLIARVVYQFFVHGHVQGDLRSDTESGSDVDDAGRRDYDQARRGQPVWAGNAAFATTSTAPTTLRARH